MKVSALVFAALVGTSSAFLPTAVPRASLLQRSVVTDPSETKEASVQEAAKNKVEEPDATEAAPAKKEKAAAAVQIEVESKEVVSASPATTITQAPNRNGPLEPGRYNTMKYSKALPFFERPPHLDGSHAGDMGFDPCGFGASNDLFYMQECEVRHARLAMLAVVGWPLSELVGPDFMLQDGRAPSVLNGFNPISLVAVLTMFSAIGVFEYNTALRRTSDTPIGKKHFEDMSKIWNVGVAGDYNFDPAGFYTLLKDDAQGRKAMRQVEIVQGRLAMLGITYFAYYEAVFGKPIVEDNLFFQPNAVLPLAAIGYFTWSQFYQLSDVRKFPIQIEYTKDGEEMIRSIKRSLGGEQQ